MQQPSCSSQAWPPALQHSCLCWFNLSCVDSPCACHVCSLVKLLQTSSRYSSFEECVRMLADPKKHVSCNQLRTNPALKRHVSGTLSGMVRAHFSWSRVLCVSLLLGAAFTVVVCNHCPPSTVLCVSAGDLRSSGGTAGSPDEGHRHQHQESTSPIVL